METLFRGIDRPEPGDREYVNRLLHWAKVAGVDDANLLSQSLWETGNFTSPRYRNDHNPMGLGITGDDVAQPFTIRNKDEAARLVVQAVYAMVKKQWHPDVPIPPQAQMWMDRIWMNKVRGKTYPKGVDQVWDENVLYDGNRATWATDPNYLNHINRFNRMVPGVANQEDVPMAITFGKVPHPAYQNRPIWKQEGKGQNNLGKRSVKGVTWHRILGSLWGTDGYFRNPSVGALTDYGVGVLAQDGTANDGVILRWNDPLGFQSGWASGTWSAAHAYGDGKQFVEKYGINAINRDRASIEISGFQTTQLSPKAKLAIAAITAYWADQYGIPWSEFPIAPQDGFSFVCWHEEFGPDNGTKKCPFDVVKAATDELIQMTADIMKKWQTGDYEHPETPSNETYAPPVTYPWLAAEEAARGLNRKINRTKVLYCPQVYVAQAETPRKQGTGKNTQVIGPPIEKGTRFKADYVYRSSDENGKPTTWVLTPYGTRVKASDLLPKIQVGPSPRYTISIRRTADQEKGEVIRPGEDV